MNFFYSKQNVYQENCVMKIYPSFVEFILCKATRQCGYEEIKKKNITDKEESQRCSVSRSRRYIKDYILCNNFEFFYTQTLNSSYDRFNLDEFKRIILKKFKAYKRKNKSFIYLIIFEKHNNGAFHLHGVLGGLGNDIVKNANGYDTLSFFTDLGFNSLSKIRDKDKTSSYITKYLTKDFVKCLSGVSYFHSKGLLLPIEKKVVINDFDAFDLVFESDFIKKYRLKENYNDFLFDKIK